MKALTGGWVACRVPNAPKMCASLSSLWKEPLPRALGATLPNLCCKNWARKSANLLLLPFLIALVLALVVAPFSARADEASSGETADESAASGVDPFEYLPLEVTASTDGLPDDQVAITVTGTNKMGVELATHYVTFDVPEGWSLVSGSTTSESCATQDGDVVSTTAVLAKTAGEKDDSGSDSGSGDTTNTDADANGSTSGTTPNTGDASTTAAIVAALVVAAALALFAAKRIGARATLSVILAALLVWNMIPTGAMKAMADEIGATGSSDDAAATDADSASDLEPLGFSKTVDLDVRGENLSVAASVFVTLAESASSDIVNLELGRSVATGAADANLTVLSEVAYAGSSDTVGELVSFDTSKIILSGSLEGAVVRDGAYTVKVAGTNEESDQLKDRTHWELHFVVDEIPEGAASEDSDYGYVELSNQPFADESLGYGLACVSYSDAAGTIAQVSSECPMEGDENEHTFDNGLYWDGTNKFRLPVKLDGIEVGMPIPEYSEFASCATGDTYEIGGVVYRTFTEADIVKHIGVPNDSNVQVVECKEDLGYTWLTFEVEGAAGYDAYEQLVEALDGGVLFGGEVTSTYKNTIVYPEGVEADSTGEKGDPFAYATTSPIAFLWAEGLERGEESTTITYLAGVHSSVETEDAEDDGDIDVTESTTFAAYDVSTADDGTSTQAPAEDVSVTVFSADQDVLKIEVSVPNDEFDSDAAILGLDYNDKDSLFQSLYNFAAGLKLYMTDGSTNLLGVPEKNKEVTLFDGESFGRSDEATSDSTDAAAATSDNSSESSFSLASLLGIEEADAATASDLVDYVLPVGFSLFKHTSLVEALPVIQVEERDDVDGMNTIYAENGNDSKSGITVKQALSDLVQTGLGINHGINIVRFLGKNFLNYATAGFTIVGFISIFIMDLLPKETNIYSIDDVMNKLNEINEKIDTIDTTVNTINVKLDEQTGKLSWQSESTTYTNLKSFLCSQSTTDILSTLDSKLAKYHELDENGNETTTACSRSTPLSRMPEKAIDELYNYLNCVDKNAQNKGLNGIAGAYTALHNVLVSGAAGSENILDVYYEYVNTKYNWDTETKAAKRAFLASFMVMYNNAYQLYSAKLGIELYRAEKGAEGTDVDYAKDQIKELERYADEISEVLYGTVDWDKLRSDYPGQTNQSSTDSTISAVDVDTDALLADNPGKTFNEIVQEKYLTQSKYMTQATDTASTTVKFIATDSSRQRTYSTKGYALQAAYDATCFGLAYASGSISLANNSWKPSCSFSLDELRTMMSRLNSLPESMRPTITDSKGNTRAVQTIAEEMQAVGFKVQNPNVKFTKKLLTVETSVLKSREEKIYGSSSGLDARWSKNGSTTELWATVRADDANAKDEVDRYSDEAKNWNYVFTELGYNVDYVGGKKIRCQYGRELSTSGSRYISSVGIGDKISDPENYIVLEASDSKQAKAGSTAWKKGTVYKNLGTIASARFGKVFNIKTGEVVKDQLLYVIESPAICMVGGFMRTSPVIACEYYAFGELTISDEGRKYMLSNDYSTGYQTNWYTQGTDSDHQNESIDIRRYNQSTD